MRGREMGKIFMDERESNIYHYFQQVENKRLTLIKASKLIGLGYRQTKRLWKAYKTQGIHGIISKKRGAKSNRSFSLSFKQEILMIIASKYTSCKPGFVTEKLEANEGIRVSDETVRQLMIEQHLWIPHRSKKQIHQRRDRKECLGELAQTDASDHLWFEKRGPRCHLHLIVDDATGKIMGGHFCEEETTLGYYRAIQPYLEREGRPVKIYCDRRGTFKVNAGKNRTITQFHRAMKELGIGMIYARSPEAKGRIERTFGTLQDRLVCELRLRNISTIDEANEYLPEFITAYNAKYGKVPMSQFNAHRSLNSDQELKYILCFKHVRKVTKHLEISYKGKIYQLDEKHEEVKKGKVEVIETLDGELLFTHNGVKLKANVFIDRPREQETNKNTERFLKSRKIVSINTPWRGKPPKSDIDEKVTVSKEEQKIIQLRLNNRIQESRLENIEIMNEFN
jgi:hypothetical protein